MDATDSVLVASALGQSGGAIEDPRTDVNGDGSVDSIDLELTENGHSEVDNRQLSSRITLNVYVKKDLIN